MSKMSALGCFFGLALASSVSAETLDGRIKRCIDGSLTDPEKSGLIKELSELTITFSPFVESNASACFLKLTDQNAEFVKGTGLVFDPAAIQAVQKAKAQAEQDQILVEQKKSEREAELAKQLIRAAAERQERKCEIIAQKDRLLESLNTHLEIISKFEASAAARKLEARSTTIQECNNWAEGNLRDAITNPVCQFIFAELGLPNSKIQGPTVLDFVSAEAAREQILSRIDNIRAEVELIKAEEAFLKTSSERDLFELKEREAQKTSSSAQVAEDDGC